MFLNYILILFSLFISTCFPVFSILQTLIRPSFTRDKIISEKIYNPKELVSTTHRIRLITVCVLILTSHCMPHEEPNQFPLPERLRSHSFFGVVRVALSLVFFVVYCCKTACLFFCFSHGVPGSLIIIIFKFLRYRLSWSTSFVQLFF